MRPNDLAFRRFLIETKAGAGGMGTVYRARDNDTGETVALKVIQADDELDEERFAREASALASLHHPGIVRYVAHGKGAEGHYLAMEWLEGEDLSTRLGREGLTIAESVGLARRVAEALAVAHAQSIVHRDVKPRNIFLVGGSLERTKMLDFGIARLRDEANVTMTGAMIGTPGYMAPEQAEGARDLDARADVFSLGCVLFRCLTGEAAFAGDNMLAVLAKTVLEETPRPSDYRIDVPDELDDLVVRLLAKDKLKRPRDGAAVAAELASLGALPLSIAAPTSRAGIALTEGERRVLCVVVMGGGSVHAGPLASFSSSRAKEAAIRLAAEQQGGRVESLAEGSHLVTISGRGAATDLAAQAARCALALRDLLPSMPIALATGAGVFDTQRASRPVGALVDRAVSMLKASPRPDAQGAASDAGIRIDDATAGLLDVRFVVAGDSGGLSLRSERDVVEGQRTLLGRPYSCVGREREISFLEGMLSECTTDSVARVALMTAPAGRGKSRVRFELLRRMKQRGDRATVLFARGDSVSAGSPFGMLAPAIRRAAGILDGEPSAITKKRLRARVGRHMRPELALRTAEFLGEMAGVPAADDDSELLVAARHDSILMGDSMQAAFSAFLEAESAAQTVVIVLEDLHWGDLPSVRFLDSALRQLAQRRLAVLAFARPEVHAVFPGLWAEREVQEMKLGALTPKASERLVREVLGDTFDDLTVEQIVERSGGNAFYLEELIRAVAVGMPSNELPDTVLGMVQARLDQMGTEAKRVLRAASIFGQTFWRGGVTELLGGEYRASGVHDWIDELVTREVVAAQGEGGLSGEAAYIFRHALLRDAAYAMLTDEDRVLGHRLAGEWLEEVGASDAMVLAEHFDQGNAPARAITWYRRAAEQALEGNDLAAAIARAESAIRCGASRAVHGELRLLVCEAEKWRGNLADAYGFGVEAARHLEAGASLWFRAVGEVIALAAQLARVDDLEVWTAEALRGDPLAGALDAKIVAICRAAAALIQVGRHQASDHVLDRVQAIAPSLARLDRLTKARVHTAWATRALHAGHFLAALTEHQSALIAFEEGGDLRNAALSRINIGVEQIELGDYEAAERQLRLAQRAAERMGLSNVLGWAHNNVGHVLLRLGRAREACEVLELAASTGRAQGSKRLEIASLAYLSRARLLLGDVIGAIRDARAAVELARDIPPLRADALAAESAALLAQGGREVEALECADEAMALIAPLRGVEGEALVRLAHVEALAAAGNLEGARAAASQAKAHLLSRAASLDDARASERMLTRVVENARLLELCVGWEI